MLSYLFEAGICWAIFYLLYMVLLRWETFFQLNRIYLLTTLLLGLVIPSLHLAVWPSVPEDTSSVAYYLQPITVTVQQLEYNMETIVVGSNVQSTFNWPILLLAIYFVGLSFFLLRMIVGLYRILQLYRNSKTENHQGYRLVITQEAHSPFSFFRLLFWSEKIKFEQEEKRHVLQHELAHMQQRHSLDVLLTEVLTIIFWCLPPIHFYKKSLRNIHEYLADAAVYYNTPKKQYGRLLLKHAQSGQQLALAHHFFHSQLKQRIIMMTRNKSSRKSLLKYFGLIPIVAGLLLAFSTSNSHAGDANITSVTNIFSKPKPFNKKKITKQLTGILSAFDSAEGIDARKAICDNFEKEYQGLSTDYPEHQTEIDEIVGDLIRQTNAPIFMKEKEGKLESVFMESKDGNGFMVVEEMPRFPGCEDLSGKERKDCALKAMLVHIYKGVQYPQEAREKEIQGTVVVGFTIDEEGNINDPKIARSIGGGCDEEVLRIVGTMPQWIPGKHYGKAVKVQYMLPVKFKLEGSSEEKALEEADQMPRFPGCEDEADEEAKKKCAVNKLISYLGENLKYPADAKKSGIEGVVALRFVVDKEGKIKKPSLIKSVGYGCDEEVMRVFEKMATDVGPWTPGQMADGKKVSVKFTLPVAFRLEGEERNKVVEPVQGLSLNNFKAYPNPAADQLSLQFDAKPGALSISLTDLDGKVIAENNQSQFDGHFEGQFDVSRVAAGTLVLMIRQGEKVFVQKILVQH